MLRRAGSRRLHGVADGGVADVTTLLDVGLDGIAEMEADVDAGQPVFGRSLREVMELSQHRARAVTSAGRQGEAARSQRGAVGAAALGVVEVKQRGIRAVGGAQSDDYGRRCLADGNAAGAGRPGRDSSFG